MSATEKRLLTPAQVVKRCEEHEVMLREGESAIDSKLFFGLDQERFEHALALAVETDDSLHNMQAINLTGSSGFRIVEGLLKKILRGQKKPDPDDICYVHNFDDPHRPLPVLLGKGTGVAFQRLVARVLRELKLHMPQNLRSAEVQRSALRAPFAAWMEETIERIQDFARENGYDSEGTLEAMKFTPRLSMVRQLQGEPVEGVEDRAANEGEMKQLPNPVKKLVRERARTFEKEFQRWLSENEIMEKGASLSVEAEVAVRALNETIVKKTVKDIFDKWLPEKNNVPPQFREKLMAYSENSFPIFLASESEEREKSAPWEARDPFIPFYVKVFVDHSETGDDTIDTNASKEEQEKTRINVPIVASRISTLQQAIGSINRGRSLGPFGYTVDQRNLSPGLAHIAIGGYWIVSLRDALSLPAFWPILKNIIKSQEIGVGQTLLGFDVIEPVPVSAPRLRVILFGPAWLMHLLAHVDDEFARIFKIRGEILTKVERTREQIHAYRAWLRAFSREEGLRSLSDDAVCALVEHSQRLAGDQRHLSTDLETLATIVQEASTLMKNPKGKVGRAEVTEVIRKRVWLSNIPHEWRLEHIKSGSLLVSTEGEAVGQINGLVVSSFDSVEQEIEAFCRTKDLPFTVPAELSSQLRQQYGSFLGDSRAELAFGFATRITASATVGKFSIVNIHKEVKLAGPSFEKADLIVQGLLRKLYAVNEPLEAHLTYAFEQTYGGVDGDSASLAKFYALTSAISGLPIRQDIAITGSLNLHGEVQPIGGANEKIEGFFDICKARGEMKSHGVIVPHQNEQNLMLREDVVQAIADKKFNVWSIKELDEGIEILFGKPPAEFHAAVKKGFERFAKRAKKFYASPKEERK